MKFSPLAGHPAGLSNLFFTEMWERMSYYGMRALLVLFMVDNIQGGLGFTDQTATATYGIYTGGVYLMALPGGWIADRLLGAQRTVLLGAMIITAGHFVLAIPSLSTFFLGLLLIIVGTGLLKPNITAMVGELYQGDDPRRDGGFTLFYMGINLGAAIGPLVCSSLGESERFGWHWGFAAAGVGMLVGVIQFQLGKHRLGTVGLEPHNPSTTKSKHWSWIGLLVVTLLSILGLSLAGIIQIDASVVAVNMAFFISAIFFAYFAWILLFGGLNSAEKRRCILIIILTMASAIFWSGFEQAGSSLNLFADRYTQREFGGFEIPAGWFQSLNAVFIITLAPLFSWLWVWLAKRNLDPSHPVKFAFGLVQLGLGFGVMIVAAKVVVAGNPAMPYFLILTYLLHTMGELCLSPVGLSAVSYLAPRKYVGQIMGCFILSYSFGSILAGILAGRFSSDNLADMPGLYTQIALNSILAGILLFAIAKPLMRWTFAKSNSGNQSSAN
ncbi:MAG: peptide MFS transporter [Proteobacteria bacterium]|jgi:proton-dependent oligopeptide transporter, POT family|nr:peptide MFS transporter [Pseudomonadota bacterium]